jgi:hypothetical protein
VLSGFEIAAPCAIEAGCTKGGAACIALRCGGDKRVSDQDGPY